MLDENLLVGSTFDGLIRPKQTERKLATVRMIDNIEPIIGADKIVCATIGGWKLVTAIDNGFKVGDLVIYFEIDSWIPIELAPFLSKGKEPREYNGVKGERLKTIRLRGQLSQGLIMPLSLVGGGDPAYDFTEGQDLTEALGIQKWEKPINAQLAGIARGNFPSFIRKTDQERIQNLKKEFEEYKAKGYTFEVTEKLEGSSMTVYINEGEFGVCSRNIDLKETEGNAFWDCARKMDLESIMKSIFIQPKNFALQGELIGPAIQGNIYGLKESEFRLFDIFDIDKQKYVSSEMRVDFSQMFDIKHVPDVGIYTISTFNNLDEVLEAAKGYSKLRSVEREGIVFKCIEDPNISFKAISNTYLEGEK